MQEGKGMNNKNNPFSVLLSSSHLDRSKSSHSESPDRASVDLFDELFVKLGGGDIWGGLEDRESGWG